MIYILIYSASKILWYILKLALDLNSSLDEEIAVSENSAPNHDDTQSNIKNRVFFFVLKFVNIFSVTN